jgi:hypothetical protein
MKYLITIAKIEQRLITPYHPRGNGLAERGVQETKKLLSKLVNNVKNNWDLHLDFAQYSLNHRIHDQHDNKPFLAMFGRHQNPFEDLCNIDTLKNDKEMVNTFIKINKEIIKPIIASKATNTQNKMKEKFDNNSKI